MEAVEQLPRMILNNHPNQLSPTHQIKYLVKNLMVCWSLWTTVVVQNVKTADAIFKAFPVLEA